jgi:hypothetical protein
VPAGPKVEEFFWVARSCHSNVEIVDPEALLRIPAHAVFAFSVHARELRRELGGLESECRVGRSGSRIRTNEA